MDVYTAVEKFDKADTIEELAQKNKGDPHELVCSAEEHNGFRDIGVNVLQGTADETLQLISAAFLRNASRLPA